MITALKGPKRIVSPFFYQTLKVPHVVTGNVPCCQQWQIKHCVMHYLLWCFSKNSKNGAWRHAEEAIWYFRLLRDVLAKQPSRLVSSSCSPSMGKIGVMDPWNNRNRCHGLAVLDAAAALSHIAWQGLFIQADFSYLNPIFFRLLRLIVVMITKGALLEDVSWALDSGELKIEMSQNGLVFSFL